MTDLDELLAQSDAQIRAAAQAREIDHRIAHQHARFDTDPEFHARIMGIRKELLRRQLMVGVDELLTVLSLNDFIDLQTDRLLGGAERRTPHGYNNPSGSPDRLDGR